MSDHPAPNRLQVATRIHFQMLRELGFGIEVGKMLKRPLYARDVLLVCDAQQGSELARLSQRYRAAPAQDAPLAAATGFQDSATAADSTGFGASQPLPAAAPQADHGRSWFDRLIA
jgi:hypothetical protein